MQKYWKILENNYFKMINTIKATKYGRSKITLRCGTSLVKEYQINVAEGLADNAEECLGRPTDFFHSEVSKH